MVWTFTPVPPRKTIPQLNADFQNIADAVNAFTSTGVGAGPYSYLVRKSGAVYEAYNSQAALVYGGSDDAGGVDGADAAAVIQATIDDAAFIPSTEAPFTIPWWVAATIKCVGDIRITDSINITNRRNFILEFESLEMPAAYDKSLISIDAPYNYHGVRIVGGILAQECTTASAPAILVKASSVAIDIRQVIGANSVDGIGIELTGDSEDEACYFNEVNVNWVTGFGKAVYLYAPGGLQCVHYNRISPKLVAMAASACVGVKIEETDSGRARNNLIFDTCFNSSGDADDIGFWNNGGIVGTSVTTLQNCYCVDLGEDSKSIVNSGSLKVIGGVHDMSKVTNTGTIQFQSVSGFANSGMSENSGTATILDTATSVVFAHGIAGTPTLVVLGATHAEVSAATWSADGDNITITVPEAVTANRNISWYAEFKP
jgi:hypothetical protein